MSSVRIQNVKSISMRWAAKLKDFKDTETKAQGGKIKNMDSGNPIVVNDI